MSRDLSSLTEELTQRAGNKCELCSTESDLAPVEVPPETNLGETVEASQCALICSTCLAQLTGQSELDTTHLRCLQDSAWSQTPAVQVMAWRVLKRLNTESWAQDLLDQMYLDESTLEWAEQGLPDEDEAPTLDSNGTRLADGDTVLIIKDLDVKGTGFVAKRGTVVKNIRLTSNPEHVDGRVNKTAIVLKTCFLKKSS